MILMYKLLSIDEGQMERNVYLKNLITETADYCFDYSMAVSDDNFEFMKINSNYDCKIMLFGDQVSETADDAQKVFVAERKLQRIGDSEFMKVKIKDDEYFVYGKDVTIKDNQDFFFFNFYRMDLLEVDGKVNYLYNGLF